ncbi:MAG TPA: CGNR zinc finger domain-containing protein [Methylomirabilota bacterium]|nr:CGNR zinc finger domain-containing protein [Methylomirabilota bacterium]
MPRLRRSFIKVGSDLGIDFANLRGVDGDPAGGLGSWRDLLDFLELHEAVSRSEGRALRAMAERDARGCEAALDQARSLRQTVRDVVSTLSRRRALQAQWIAAVNQALAWGAGWPRLERGADGWQPGFVPACEEPVRALAPIARAVADLIARGRGEAIRRCANPRCSLYFRDRSRGRRRRWCSMAVCGNRMKVAAHARRHGRRRPSP